MDTFQASASGPYRPQRSTPVRRFGLLLAGILWALAACSRPIPDAWRQIDLWATPPAVLEPADSRTLPLRDHLKTLLGRKLRVLNPRPGERLVWRVELGQEPRLSVRTIAQGGPCRFLVGVREEGGALTSQFDEVDLPRGRHIAPERAIELGAFAGRTVELELTVANGDDGAGGDAKPCRQARWASPKIVHRGGAPQPQRTRPNVLLIGADTLRADALGAWGRTPSITPALDGLAAVSDVWTQAYASSNNTNPSFISLMTGLYAKNHGVYDLRTPLPDSATTLAEVLQTAGYRTWGVAAATHLGHGAGLQQGFERLEVPHGQFFAETVVDIGLGWLEEPLDRPFFLFLHMFDPHVPHNPPAQYHVGLRPEQDFGQGPIASWVPFRATGARDYVKRPPRNLPGHVDLYPSEVAYLDRQIGRVLDFLRSRRLLETTIVVFVSDHGETLGEHGQFFDHLGLRENTTHVPLMIHWPGQTEARVHDTLVQHFDVFPTVLGHLGLDLPDQDGRDLSALAESGRGRRAVFAQHASDHGAMVRTDRYRYYLNRSDPLHPQGPYLYDLEADPGEQTNLAGTGHPEEATLAAMLERWLAERRAGEAPVPSTLTEEQRQQLEALGYAQ